MKTITDVVIIWSNNSNSKILLIFVAAKVQDTKHASLLYVIIIIQVYGNREMVAWINGSVSTLWNSNAPKSEWNGVACVDVEQSQEDIFRGIRQTRKSKGV